MNEIQEIYVYIPNNWLHQYRLKTITFYNVSLQILLLMKLLLLLLLSLTYYTSMSYLVLTGNERKRNNTDLTDPEVMWNKTHSACVYSGSLSGFEPVRFLQTSALSLSLSLSEPLSNLQTFSSLHLPKWEVGTHKCNNYKQLNCLSRETIATACSQ
jgi:hypothetical protein